MSHVQASRKYYPGHLVYREQAFARVLPRDNADEQCEFCSKSSENLLSCNKCSAVKYCGLECQKKDSKDHGNECANMHKLRGDRFEDFVRLLGRIIFKIKGKDWKTITRNVMGKEVSFEDIDSHYEEMTGNPMYNLLYEGTKEALKDFIGEENLPGDKNLMKIFGKVKFNSEKFSTVLPTEFFFGKGQFQHECIPNCNLEVKGNTMIVWALRHIEISEKVTVSYRTFISSNLMRAPNNEDSLEICKCTECSLPYGDSVLTKIIDKTKAYQVIRFSERIIQQVQNLKNLNLEDNERIKFLVDQALQHQIGVLGNTNALHLKLLAQKIVLIDGINVEKKMTIVELIKHMVSAFGEYYSELEGLYDALMKICYSTGNLHEAAFYLKKKKLLQIHQPKN